MNHLGRAVQGTLPSPLGGAAPEMPRRHCLGDTPLLDGASPGGYIKRARMGNVGNRERIKKTRKRLTDTCG